MDDTTLIIAGILVTGMAVALAVAAPSTDPIAEDWQTPDYPPTDDQTQVTSTMEDIAVALSPSTWTPVSEDAQSAANVGAFLDMIAYAEGTAMAEGYRVMFGYPRYPDRLINSFADHPRQRFSFTNSLGKTLTTSAAGRYQFLERTWDDLRSKLGLQDFSPANQDAGAIELIRQRGALNDVRAGRTTAAIAKVSKVWASLPGAGYAQPERKLSNLLAAYSNAGGTVNEA